MRRKSSILNQIPEKNHAALLSLCLSILQKPSGTRMNEEIEVYYLNYDILFQVLRVATSQIKFFEKIAQEQGSKVVKECLIKLSLEIHQESTIIFEKGERGDKFYIILSGKVGVYVYDSSCDQAQIKQEPKALIKPCKEHTLEQRNMLVKYFIKNLNKVNQLKEGDSFGEMALINEAPRLATIVCESQCIMGVLSKNDFKNILQKAEEKIIISQIKELEECGGFQNLSKRLLTILHYSFKSQNYAFRDSVYKQRDKCQQELYLIQKGEFMIMQQRNSHLNKQIAILNRGSFFGDLESFKQLKYRLQSVYCNSQEGKVLVIELPVLLKNLQASNEVQLYDELMKACDLKEKSRSIRVSVDYQIDYSPMKTQPGTYWNSTEMIAELIKNKIKNFKILQSRSTKNDQEGIFSNNEEQFRIKKKIECKRKVSQTNVIQRTLQSSHIRRRICDDLTSQCYSYIHNIRRQSQTQN